MIAATLVLLLAGNAPPGASTGAESGGARLDACRLLTAGEIAAVQGGRVAETKPTSRTAAGGRLAISDCFYRSEPFESSVSLEVTRAAKSSSDSAREQWKAVFHAANADEETAGGAVSKEPERARESPPRAVDGIGDEAFWIGNPASGALYVRRGGAYIRISVGGADEEAVKLRRATELARKALGRL